MNVELREQERLRVSAVVHQCYYMPEVFGVVQDIIAGRLDELEVHIRCQAAAAPIGSMEWRAHMADLAHLETVRGLR